MTYANDDMDRLKQDNNLLARIEEIERRLDSVGRSSVEPINLSDMSSDLGEVRMGRFLATGSDGEPTDSSFSGVFMSAEPETFGEKEYHLGGINSGELTFGLNADTGAGEFCSGNATIDQDGISGTDLLKWMIRQTATSGLYNRIGKIGMALEGEDTIPSFEVSYSSPDGSDDLLNGDFENDFTNWTKTTETDTTWEILDDFNMSKVLYADTARTAITGAGTTELVLTSDRVACDGNVSFNGQCFTRIAGVSGTATRVGKVEVKWYDHASAGSLISTNVIQNITAWTSGDYIEYGALVTSPSTALSYEIVVTFSTTTATAVSVVTVCLIDNISMSAVDVNQKLWLTDNGLATTNGMYPHTAVCWAHDAVSNSTLTTYTATSQAFNTYSTQTGAAANNGDTYDWTVMLEKGTYALNILYVKSSAGGRADVTIDGVEVVTALEFYASSAAWNQESTTTSIDITYSGRHDIRFTVDGKHASSSDYSVYLTKITLIRTGD